MFKEKVWAVETSCHVTGVVNPNHLIGSNISFQDSGLLLISPRADRDSLARIGVEDEDSAIQKPFTHLQRRYLDFHRDKIFLSRSR